MLELQQLVVEALAPVRKRADELRDEQKLVVDRALEIATELRVLDAIEQAIAEATEPKAETPVEPLLETGPTVRESGNGQPAVRPSGEELDAAGRNHPRPSGEEIDREATARKRRVKSKTARKPAESQVSPHTVEKVRAFLWEHNDREFTTREIREALNLGHGALSFSLSVLRDRHEVRKVGVAPGRGMAFLWQGVVSE